jgi:hypothetical protein
MGKKNYWTILKSGIRENYHQGTKARKKIELYYRELYNAGGCDKAAKSIGCGKNGRKAANNAIKEKVVSIRIIACII